METADPAKGAYGKRLHRAARLEFRKFWSDYRLWVFAASAFLAPIALQAARHGMRSVLNVGETLENGLLGAVFSLVGTYLIAMRKGAETLDAGQQTRAVSAE